MRTLKAQFLTWLFVVVEFKNSLYFILDNSSLTDVFFASVFS